MPTRLVPTRLLALTAAAAVLATGCGGVRGAIEAVSERAAENRQIDIAREQTRDLGVGDMEFLPEEEQCVEDEARARRFNVRRATSDPDAADLRIELWDIFLDCIDDPGSNPRLHEAMTRVYRAVIGLPDLSVDEGGCMVRGVVAESDHPSRTFIQPDTDDILLMLDLFEQCLTPENFAIVSQQEGTGPQAYGEDERLDRLHDDCIDGDERTCDILYLVTAPGSEYHEVGATCGGRLPEADVYCAPETAIDETGFAPDDAPELELLATDCRDGDLTACDLLTQIAQPASEHQRIGQTCGGRMAVGAVPDCRTRLGG